MDVFLGYQQVGQSETRNERVKELAAEWELGETEGSNPYDLIWRAAKSIPVEVSF
jgi:hypothetical protein